MCLYFGTIPSGLFGFVSGHLVHLVYLGCGLGVERYCRIGCTVVCAFVVSGLFLDEIWVVPVCEVPCVCCTCFSKYGRLGVFAFLYSVEACFWKGCAQGLCKLKRGKV